MRLFIRIQFVFFMRKTPRQQRARLLVESIIDAATRVIAEQGLEAATTARIAARAGVSVGSLYQYFEHKEAVWDAVLARIAHDLSAVVQRHAERFEDGDLGAFVRALLSDVWALLEADGGRYLQVTRYWAQLDFPAVINPLERQLHNVLLLHIGRRAAGPALPDLPARLYILVNSTLFTMVRHVSDPAPMVSKEQLVRTLADIATASLEPPGARLPSSR